MSITQLCSCIKSCFLVGLTAPVFCKPITTLFNLSPGNINSTASVATCHNTAQTEGQLSQPACRLLSDINNTNPLQDLGENNSLYILLSSLSYSTINPKPYGPVCFSAHRISSYLSYTYCTYNKYASV